MRTATFLFLRTGLNLFKPGVNFTTGLAKTSVTDNSADQAGIQVPDSSDPVNDEINDRKKKKNVAVRIETENLIDSLWGPVKKSRLNVYSFKET